MTGKIRIDQVLQSNKERIQQITTELEDIVRKGYYHIINNTENLVSLTNSDIKLPDIHLPDDVEMPEKKENPETTEIEDEIWENLNSQEFFKASLLISQNIEKPSITRLKNYLVDYNFYSVFDFFSQAKNRMLGYCILQEKSSDILELLINFVCSQLYQKLSLFTDIDSYLAMTSDITSEIMSEDFMNIISQYGYAYNDLNVEDFIQSHLEKFMQEVTRNLDDIISKIDKPLELKPFFAKKT